MQAVVARQAHEAARLQRRVDKQTALRRSLEAHLKSVWADFVEAARVRDAQVGELTSLREANASMEQEMDARRAGVEAAKLDAKALLVRCKNCVSLSRGLENHWPPQDCGRQCTHAYSASSASFTC